MAYVLYAGKTFSTLWSVSRVYPTLLLCLPLELVLCCSPLSNVSELAPVALVASVFTLGGAAMVVVADVVVLITQHIHRAREGSRGVVVVVDVDWWKIDGLVLMLGAAVYCFEGGKQ